MTTSSVGARRSANRQKKQKRKKSRKPYGGWAAYNLRLVGRGNMTLLVDPELLVPAVWHGTPDGEAHRPETYSDAAIRWVLTVAAIMRLPLRQAEGFCRGVFELYQVNLPVPTYSTLCRRRRKLKLKLPRRLAQGARRIAIDSTGFITYEPSAWRQRKHREVLPKRRWRKLHIMIDTETMEILGVHVTGCEGYGSGDSSAVKPLLEQCADPIAEARADGAYDKAEPVRQPLSERGARVIIPPRKDAVIAQLAHLHTEFPAWVNERDSDIARIQVSDLDVWKEQVDYGQRSRIEAVIGAIKTTLGAMLRARTEGGADAELLSRCEAYNRLLLIGA
jgi:hypothetical protein